MIPIDPVQWSVVKETILVNDPRYRHKASWHSQDGVNKLPLKHVVLGPLFKERFGQEEESALSEFSTLFHRKLREFPPCDPDRVMKEQQERR